MQIELQGGVVIFMVKRVSPIAAFMGSPSMDPLTSQTAMAPLSRAPPAIEVHNI
jgi:hypothetical protein